MCRPWAGHYCHMKEKVPYIKEIEGGVPEFDPFIRYNKFDDSSINFSVIMRGKESDDLPSLNADQSFLDDGLLLAGKWDSDGNFLHRNIFSIFHACLHN